MKKTKLSLLIYEMQNNSIKLCDRELPTPLERKPHPSFLTGFTLIETIMAVTIFSLLAAGLIGCFVSGVKLWQRAQADNLAHYDVALVLEKIAKELRQSADINLIPFEGTVSQISFPTISGNSILKVTYGFNSSQGILSRGQIELKDIVDGKEKENYSEKKIIYLEKCSLNYLYLDDAAKELIWTDKLEKEKGIPKAVKITLELKNEKYDKLVFIPIS